MNESDPSVLRFLIASRQEVTSTQLRDDLLSMLVAGHETTGSVLTWTLHLLASHPDKLAKVYPSPWAGCYVASSTTRLRCISAFRDPDDLQDF